MWHDGRFTYLRSGAQESPALYELKDGRPSLVAYDLTAERSVYVARHVLGQRLASDRQEEGSLAPRSQGPQGDDPDESSGEDCMTKPAGAVPAALSDADRRRRAGTVCAAC